MDDREYQLIAKHLSGEATADEEAQLQAWVGEDPSRSQLVENLGRAWERSRGSITPSGRVDVRWNRLAARITADRQPARVQPVPRRFGYPAIVFLRAAAVLAIVIVAGLLWRIGPRSTPQTASVREVRTAKAQRLALRLPDGTRVVMAPASRLTYDATTFGTSNRTVQLDGQAYFEVQHDPVRPFLVEIDGVIARDLGTRFTARAFPGEPTAVAVAEGRVGVAKVSDTSAITMVDPGQVGTLAGGEVRVSRISSAESFFAWTDGRLVFRDTPLDKALNQLDRWYDVRFILADPSLAGRPITATFVTESLAEVLDLLRVTLDVDVRRTGDTVTVRPVRQ